MKEKSDKTKLKEKRGVIGSDEYVGWKEAREAKSTGTASMIFDPICERSVSVLSRGEYRVFWLLRFRNDVEEIYDQFPLKKEIVDRICSDNGMRAYTQILTTDFLVKKTDGTYEAISVKGNREKFRKKLEGKNNARLIRRQFVEMQYWQSHGIPFRIIFGDEVSDVYIKNIKDVMIYWQDAIATNTIGKLKHLIAHGVIVVPMDKERLRFGELARLIEVEEIYESYKR